MLKYLIFSLIFVISYSRIEENVPFPYRIKDAESARQFKNLLLEAFRVYNFSDDSVTIPFPCEPTGRSDPRPTNARRLLPGDIDLVIAMGDSLTAAFGADATSFFNLFVDYRGSSFSVGGLRTVDEVSTIPNILKVYNPNIQGFSIGDGDANSENAKLNVAVSGATSYDFDPQISNLLNKLQNHDRADWKLLTLFIGGNDLCASCDDPARYSPANYRANVEKTLDAIKSQLRNVFVNIVLPPDVTLLAELSYGLCGLLHPFECKCNTDPMTHQRQKEYVQALYNLVALPKYHDQLDFYVVVQPFLQDIDLPRNPDGTPDETYFAPDCFHFSTKAHGAAGLALWNNMMESVDDKKINWIIGEPFECPAPGQFLQ